MQRTYEFEIFEDSGFFVALPFDFVGGTQGETLEECYEMTADYLRTLLEDCELEGKEPPTPTFENTPKRGGKVVVFSVVAGLDTIEKVSKADAAKMLGVSNGRVSQLLSEKKLESFSVDGHEWITKASVQARLEESPTAGRPRKRRELTLPIPTPPQSNNAHIMRFAYTKKTTSQTHQSETNLIYLTEEQLKEG